MNGTTFAAYVRKQTKTNTTTLPNADIVVLANVVKDDIAAGIVANVDEKYFEMELTRSLEVNIRNYTIADDVLKHMSHVEAMLDGTNWVPLLEADSSQFDDVAILQNEKIKALYSSRSPEFLIRGREVIILSGDDIIDVTNGLKMVAEIYPEDITADMLSQSTDLSIPSSDTTHALPRQVHKFWATKVIIEYKQSRDKPIPLTQQEQRIDADTQDVYTKLAPRNNNRSFKAQTPRDDGQDY